MVRLLGAGPGFVWISDCFFQAVTERRTVLYNKVVTSYHKAKIERAGLARELEAVKGEAFSLLTCFSCEFFFTDGPFLPACS
jgi:hypothetical protein